MSTKHHLCWANTAVSTRYGQGALPGAQSTDSQDRLCFKDCHRAVKNTLGVREAGVRDLEQGLVSRVKS